MHVQSKLSGSSHHQSSITRVGPYKDVWLKTNHFTFPLKGGDSFSASKKTIFPSLPLIWTERKAGVSCRTPADPSQ